MTTDRIGTPVDGIPNLTVDGQRIDVAKAAKSGQGVSIAKGNARLVATRKRGGDYRIEVRGNPKVLEATPAAAGRPPRDAAARPQGQMIHVQGRSRPKGPDPGRTSASAGRTEARIDARAKPHPDRETRPEPPTTSPRQ